MPVCYERAWAMPSARTFRLKPIATFIRKWSVPGGRTLDVFPYSPPHRGISQDGLDLLRAQPPDSVDTCLYDPVYSRRQQHEIYKIKGTSYATHPEYFTAVEREIMRVVKPHGRCLKFMWNSKSLPGFEVVAGLLVAHGGLHNDTICTAYQRVQRTLG